MTEMIDGPLDYDFRRPIRSNDQGLCVEFGDGCAESHGVVAFRDSKDQAGPVLTFSVAAARSFIDGLKVGAFA